MKKFLLAHLICPACLPDEIALNSDIARMENDDILSGKLSCKKCKRNFPIRDGVALLLADPQSYAVGGPSRYEEKETINRYLWSHYADLCGHPATVETNSGWTGFLADRALSAFDAGCAVGRLTFEMASRSEWAVGCDLSSNFIRVARQLARERRFLFTLPLEGNLRETFSFEFPETLRSDNADFIVADAQAVPFAGSTFQQIASINLLDRVNYPLAHLYEMNRVAQKTGAAFLFADPFSWSPGSTPQERWLGGTEEGKYSGRGMDNVRSLLKGTGNIINPAWNIIQESKITWMMRSHVNHCELITSDVLVAARS